MIVKDLVELKTRINDPQSSLERPTTSAGHNDRIKIQLSSAAVAPDNLESNPSAQCQESVPNGWQWTKESALPMTHKAPLGCSRDGTDTSNVSLALWSCPLHPCPFEQAHRSSRCKRHRLRASRKNPPLPSAGPHRLTSPRIGRLTTAASGIARQAHAWDITAIQS